MSFCKKQRKNRLLSQPTFWQGQKDSFSSLDARRSGRLYRAKGHGIHCRSILVLLQEANKKIGCFCNRPFWQGQKDSFSSLDARWSGRLYRAKGHGIHCRPILVLLQEAKKKSAAFATDLLAGAEGLFLLARRSSVRTALPCQRARYSLPFYSRPSARSE